MSDNDEQNLYSESDEREEKMDEESEVDIDDLKGNSTYAIWKQNAQYLYDLLLHTHTSWPCSSCVWGPVINVDQLSPVSQLSQRIYLATHTGRVDFMV